MPALPRRADRRGDHLIVCGDGPLSFRITEELTSRYGERVTVILPSRRRNHGPQISALIVLATRKGLGRFLSDALAD
jgi:hypothetical protein